MDIFEEKRKKLDEELSFADINAGIAFGEDIYAEFKKRGWLTMEIPSVMGVSLFPEKMPAYNKTHFAFESLDIEPLDFKVGGDGQ